MPTKEKIIDLYFMEARCKLIEVAAYQDRVDRHTGEEDYRHHAFLKAIEAMQNPAKGETRVQAVLNSLSDPSHAPIEKVTIQGAFGAAQSS